MMKAAFLYTNAGKRLGGIIMAKIMTSAEQLIGHTPLMEFTHIEKELGLEARLLAKLEFLSPGGSVKDRVARNMIEEAEKGETTKEENDLWMSETLKQRNLVDLDWALANLNMSDEYTPYGKGDGSIKNIKCPVALTMAEKDIVVPDYMVMDNFHALGALATLLPYENCGHSPMVDCPDRLAKDVVEFFEK